MKPIILILIATFMTACGNDTGRMNYWDFYQTCIAQNGYTRADSLSFYRQQVSDYCNYQWEVYNGR